MGSDASAHAGSSRRQAPQVALRDDPGHLIRVSQQAHVALSAYHKRTSLTPVQFAILLSLTAAPGIDQRTVGDLASLDKSTVADTVARLARMRLVERQRDPADGRRNLLHPTAEARRRVEVEAPHLRQIDEQFLSPLGSQRRRQLLRQLRAIGFAHRVDPATLVVHEEPAGFSIAEASWAFGRLIRICHQVHNTLWSAAVGAALTPVQWEVLTTLSRYQQVDQRTISELISLDKSTCANVVERLERRRLLMRVRDASDGRRNLVTATPSGVDTTERVSRFAQVVGEELLAPLPREDRLGFVTSMQRVALGRFLVRQ